MAFQVKLDVEANRRFEYVAKRLKVELGNDKNAKIFVIVPDQFNFACQKLILEKLDTNVISQIEVLSFNRLVYRIYEEANYFKPEISNVERLTIIKNIVDQNIKKLKFFGKYTMTSKVITEINQLINLVNKNVIDMNEVEKMASSDDKSISDTLRAKLADVKLLYTKYVEEVEKINMDFNVLSVLPEKLGMNKDINGSSFYLCEFYNFTNEQIGIIKMLEKFGAKITLVCQMDKYYDVDDYQSVFVPVQSLLNKLQVKEADCSVIADDELLHNVPKEQEFVDLKETYIKKCEPVNYNTEHIYFNEYSSSDKEVFDVCLKIMDLVRKGYRYRDIAISVLDLESYDLKLIDYLKSFNIPFYYENRKELKNSKVVRTIMKMISIFESNFKITEVISFLKEELFNKVTPEDVYAFENYVQLKDPDYLHELSYKLEKDNAWEPADDVEEKAKKKLCLERVNKVYDFLMSFKDRSESFGYKPCKIDDYYNFINSFMVDEFKPEFLELEDREIAKLDNILEKWSRCETAEMSLNEFNEKLKILISDVAVSRVDEKIDEVVIYDAQRTNFLSVKNLIMVGYKNMPKSMSSLTSLFSEKEGEKLEENHIEFNKNFKSQVYESKFIFFNMIEKVTDNLMISYTNLDKSNKAAYATDLNRLLIRFEGKLKEFAVSDDEIIDCLLPTDESIIKFILSKFDTIDLEKDLIVRALNRVKDKELLFNLIKYQKPSEIKVNDDINTLKLSFSGIEKYVECPFSYFLKYKLSVDKKKELTYDYLTTGNMIHEVFEQLFNKVIDEEIDLKTYTHKQMISDIDDIFENKLSTEFSETKRNLLSMKRTKKVVYRNTQNLIDQLKLGDFKVAHNELEFGDTPTSVEKGIEFTIDDKVKVCLGGKVDRADICETDDAIYVNVVDYKTGVKDFDLEKAKQGINMQLVIYLKILLEKYKGDKKVIPGGIYLSKINSKYTDKDESLSDTKADGIFNRDYEALKHIDANFKNSDFLPIKFKQDGSIHGNSESKVCSTDDFYNIVDTCVNKAEEIAASIVHGDMDVKPLTDENDKKSVCRTCIYKNICKS
ncbi:MAG: PD-(D/E)XK nuclease family protein [Clostridia bacterium]|nr:PD-(D/E)XK nuclease family protein [Clostridia bacterium]